MSGAFRSAPPYSKLPPAKQACDVPSAYRYDYHRRAYIVIHLPCEVPRNIALTDEGQVRAVVWMQRNVLERGMRRGGPEVFVGLGGGIGWVVIIGFYEVLEEAVNATFPAKVKCEIVASIHVELRPDKAGVDGGGIGVDQI
jgi:hypothetical protein